MEKVMNIGKQL
jgi:hypothetical protein